MTTLTELIAQKRAERELSRAAHSVLQARLRQQASDRVLVPVTMAVRRTVPVPIWRQRLTDKDLTADIYVSGTYKPRGSDDAA